MRKFRLIIIGISILFIFMFLFFIDYQNFLSRSNLASYLGILAMLFNILAMHLSNKHEARR